MQTLAKMNENDKDQIKPSRPCERCKGAKEVQDFRGGMKECVPCNGTGIFEEIDKTDILLNIIASRGKNKGKLKVAMVSPYHKDGIKAARAYYVWRLARFHGGVDMSQPIMADMAVYGDPYRKDLDVIADEIAKKYLGSNMRAALKWGRALGMI